MKLLFIFIITALTVACSSGPIEKIDTVYSLDDVNNAGIKVKGKFDIKFPEAKEANWAYVKGREVAVLIYPSSKLANIYGLAAAKEQTEIIEVLEKNIAYGEKVEKTKCRGHGDGGGWTGRGGIRVSSNFDSVLGLNNTLIINKLYLYEPKNLSYQEATCPRREPLYTGFMIHGNLVILAESAGSSPELTLKFLEDLIKKLP